MSADVRRLEDELVLSPDFAARVLAQADAVIALRRRRGKAVLIAAVVAATSVAGSIALHSALAPTVHKSASPAYVARADDRAAPSLTDKDEARAMTYLFPDASPLARFVQAYSATMAGIGADEQTTTTDDAQDEWL